MPTMIVAFGELYCEWSTVVDAPVTVLMSEDDFISHYKEEYGNTGIIGLGARMTLAERTGSSSTMYTKQSLLCANHAGEEGAWLSEQGIIAKYTVKV